MPRVTYVKKAQQRYATVPVLDEQGDPKMTPIMRKDGTPKRTKSGRPIMRTLTVEDTSKPLPPRTCDYCHTRIEIGTAYQWIQPKSGPYGGRKRFRHAGCPSWQPWEYSSSLSARISQIQHEAYETISAIEDYESAESARDEIASSIRELADEKEESASNMEEGFGHETAVSEELSAAAEQLNGWADEVEGVSLPEFDDDEDAAEDVDGTARDEWLEEVRQLITEAVDSCSL